MMMCSTHPANPEHSRQKTETQQDMYSRCAADMQQICSRCVADTLQVSLSKWKKYNVFTGKMELGRVYNNDKTTELA